MPVAGSPLKLLFVASECYPLIKTGGLADVVGSLPLALCRAGVDARALVPGFPSVLKAAKKTTLITKIADLFGGPAELWAGKASTGLKVMILKAPHLYDFEGNPYMDGAVERAGNHLRYAALARMGAEIGLGQHDDWLPDIVHAHDWQAGLTAAYLHKAGSDRPKTVFTIHNLAFQGLFPKGVMADIGLAPSLFHKDGLEFWDKVSFLKAGIVYSDRVTTVSPSYANEIQTEEGGMGMGGLLKSRTDHLSGIVNGIDTDVWNPAADESIIAPFDARRMAGKAKCKKALQAKLGLDSVNSAPLFAVISRLTDQKGLDLVADALPHITGMGGQLVVLGSGESALEAAFRRAAADNPGRIATVIGYDEPLAHQIQAGADFILVPSRFEPCGLTQLCGLRYGAIPVVARVGGLADTIIDANGAALQAGCATGIQFSLTTRDHFGFALNRAFALYADKAALRRIRANAFRQDVSWDTPADAYISLYTKLMQSG